MVNICQTGLLILNFEIIPKKSIFWFLPKISAGHAWSWKFFFANFQILGPLGCQGWVVIPQNVKKSQNHCTLLYNAQLLTTPPPSSISSEVSDTINWTKSHRNSLCPCLGEYAKRSKNVPHSYNCPNILASLIDFLNRRCHVNPKCSKNSSVRFCTMC